MTVAEVTAVGVAPVTTLLADARDRVNDRRCRRG